MPVNGLHLLFFIVGSTVLTGCATVDLPESSPGHVEHLDRPEPLRGAPGDVVALILMSTDCPVANAMAPQIRRDIESLEGRGVRCYLVYPRPGTTAEQMAAHAASYRLDARQVPDPDHRIVTALDGTITPQAYVLSFESDDAWLIRYSGRVNDLYASIGNRRDLVTERSWHDAAIATLDGAPMEIRSFPAVGCMIERRR